jgi:hypothetical protein
VYPLESLPSHFTHVPTHCTSSFPRPDHVLALSGPSDDATTAPVLIPIHGLVYAFSCSSLSTFDLSKGGLGSQGAVVPIVRCRLPFHPRPEIFDLLHAYIYTRSADELIDRLMPRSDDELSGAVANVKALWALVVAFGVADQALWEAMDLVYTGSLAKLVRRRKAELVCRE